MVDLARGCWECERASFVLLLLLLLISPFGSASEVRDLMKFWLLAGGRVQFNSTCNGDQACHKGNLATAKHHKMCGFNKFLPLSDYNAVLHGNTGKDLAR